MSWRRAHGDQAQRGRLIVLESTPSDELPAASPLATARPDRGPDGRFLPGNRVGRANRLRPGPRGGLSELELRADPAWLAAHRWAKRYASHRRAELAHAHGGEISAAVGAMTETAGNLLADSRFWRAKAMSEGNADWTRLAAQLSTSARQTERDCWELSAREAACRPPGPVDVPWLIANPTSDENEPADDGGTRAHPDDDRAATGRAGAATGVDDDEDNDADAHDDDEDADR